MTPLFEEVGGRFPEPRAFQYKAHEALRQGARDGHRRQVIMAPTGAGKTFLGMRVISEALKKGKRAMFLCDRRTLIHQTSETATRYGLGNHSIIMADHPRLDLRKQFQIASLQTLNRRGWPEVDVLIVDECFPGGTMVETPSGSVPIRDIRKGQPIFCACGETVVVSTFKSRVNATVNVRLSDGRQFECTYDHPVFTGMGWRPAGTLERGARLVRLQDMPGLWCDDEALSHQNRAACRASRIGIDVLSPDMLREILREEAEEPDAQPWDQGEAIRDLQGERASTCSEMGKRKRDDAHPGEAPRDSRRGLGGGTSNPNRHGAPERIPDLLQGGSREPLPEGGCGTRWEQPPISETPGDGREEGCSASWPRVESVEVVEYPGGIDVFNLRVAGHPSYFANGVLVHNCHTQYKTWVDFVTSDDCKAMVVGLSATPFSKGLGRVFTNLINAATMHDLTELGVLVPMRVFSCRRPDMTGAETSGGEWTDRAAEERELVLVGDVVSEWARIALGLKTIVFGATIAHCTELVKQFNEAGIHAALFTSETTEEERKALLDDYRQPDSYIRVLVSVEALAKGFDVPDVGCVVDARPLRKSLSTAIQMWGRGLRSSPETGKTECLLLDFSGNIIRFADDYSDVFYNGLDELDKGEKLDREVRKDEEREPKGCPKCGYTPMGKRCVQCGYEPAPLARIENLPGQMQEITLNGKKLAPDAGHLWAQLATYAKTHSKPENQQGRAAHLFREMTGSWPPREFRIESAPVVEPTRNVLGKIRSLQIAFHHRRAS